MNNTQDSKGVEMATACVAFVIALAFFFWWGSDDESPADKKHRAEMAHIVVTGKNLLRDHLRDGGSAKISDVRAFVAADIACGTVNAKNAFGAYAGKQLFMVDIKAGGVMLEREVPASILAKWPASCK